MMYALSKIIENIEKIKTICDPEAIYLFGSYALNNANKYSDVDIAIIKKKCKRKTYASF